MDTIWELPELWDARVMCQGLAQELLQDAARDQELVTSTKPAKHSDPFLPAAKRRKHSGAEGAAKAAGAVVSRAGEASAGYESDVSLSSDEEATESANDDSGWTCYNRYIPEWREGNQLLLCGTSNMAYCYRCASCGAPRSDTQLAMRVAAVLNTADLYRSTHKQLKRRVLREVGCGLGPGLSFPSELVAAEIARQVAARLAALQKQRLESEQQQQQQQQREQQEQEQQQGLGPPGPTSAGQATQDGEQVQQMSTAAQQPSQQHASAAAAASTAPQAAAAGVGQHPQQQLEPAGVRGQQQQGQQAASLDDLAEGDAAELEPGVGYSMQPAARLLLPAVLSNVLHQQAQRSMRQQQQQQQQPPVQQGANASHELGQQPVVGGHAAPAPAPAAAAAPALAPAAPAAGPRPVAGAVLSKAAKKKLKESRRAGRGSSAGLRLRVLNDSGGSSSSGSDEDYVPEQLRRQRTPARSYPLRSRAAAGSEGMQGQQHEAGQQPPGEPGDAPAMAAAAGHSSGAARRAKGEARREDRRRKQLAQRQQQQQQQQQVSAPASQEPEQQQDKVLAVSELPSERVQALGRDLSSLAVLVQQAALAGGLASSQVPGQQAQAPSRLQGLSPLHLLTYGLSAAPCRQPAGPPPSQKQRKQHHLLLRLAPGWVPGDASLTTAYQDAARAFVRQPAAGSTPLKPRPTTTGLTDATVLALLGVALPAVEELYCFKGRAVAKGMLRPADWLVPDKRGKVPELPAAKAYSKSGFHGLLPDLTGSRAVVLRSWDGRQLQEARALQQRGLLQRRALEALLRDWQQAPMGQLQCSTLRAAATAGPAVEQQQQQQQQGQAGPSSSSAAARQARRASAGTAGPGGAAGGEAEAWQSLWSQHVQARQQQQQRVRQHFLRLAARRGTPWRRCEGAAAAGAVQPRGSAADDAGGVRAAGAGELEGLQGDGAAAWADAVHSAALALGMRGDVVEAARRRCQSLLQASAT